MSRENEYKKTLPMMLLRWSNSKMCMDHKKSSALFFYYTFSEYYRSLDLDPNFNLIQNV